MDSYTTCFDDLPESPETGEESTPNQHQTNEKELIQMDERNNTLRAHTNGHPETTPLTEQDAPLSFDCFMSKVARSLSDEDLEQIKFIFRDYFGDLVSLPSSGYDVLNTLKSLNEININNVLFLQILCAVIDNDGLIDVVHRWAQSSNSVIHFDPPVRCTYNWKLSGPLHIKGAKFEQYTEHDLEALVGRAKNMLSTFVTLHDMSGNRTERKDVTTGLNQIQTILNIYPGDLSDELNIHPQFTCLAENTVPKQYAVEDLHRMTELNKEIIDSKNKVKELDACVEALTLENSRLCETVRQLEDYKNDKNEEIDRIKAQLFEKEKETVSLNKSLEFRKQDDEQLKSRLRKAYDDLENMEKLVQKLKAENIELAKRSGILKLNEENLMDRIAELNGIIEMKEASLLNERNAKMRAELTRKLQFISEHSLSVRKVYGNFDPGGIPIPACQSECFKHTFTYKVVRLYPQVKKHS